MRDGDDFRAAVRRGAKASRPTVVSHVLAGEAPATTVGFVVSKAVGGAVQRNRVKRRLRHLVREHLDTVPAGSRVVVRALPAAASADGPTLARDLEASLVRAAR